MSRKHHVFVYRSAPYANSRGSAAMDLMLTAATFDQQVTAVFMDQGIFQLLSGQDSSDIGLKNLSQAFPALELYGIDDVLVSDDALASSGLSEEQLVMPVRKVSCQDVAELLAEADQVFVY